MRFDEPDVRDAYRRGVRDFYETITGWVKSHHARQIDAWLGELDAWEHGEPPTPPPGLS
jgi:hypothetical protein